jgi:hypothetical protein
MNQDIIFTLSPNDQKVIRKALVHALLDSHFTNDERALLNDIMNGVPALWTNEKAGN